jgi:hypothetical protein
MRGLTVFCLVAGPAGSLIATTLWTGGRYGTAGGTVLVLAMTLWCFGLVGLLERVRPAAPRIAPPLLLFLLFGVTGGMAFGFQGFFEAVFNANAQESLDALAVYPLESTLLLWIPGPMMPIGLVLLAALIAWRRLVPLWTAGLLALGGVTFPLSRIPRIDLIAYLADGLIVAAFATLAGLIVTGRLDRAVAAAAERKHRAGSRPGPVAHDVAEARSGM